MAGGGGKNGRADEYPRYGVSADPGPDRSIAGGAAAGPGRTAAGTGPGYGSTDPVPAAGPSRRQTGYPGPECGRDRRPAAGPGFNGSRTGRAVRSAVYPEMAPAIRQGGRCPRFGTGGFFPHHAPGLFWGLFLLFHLFSSGQTNRLPVHIVPVVGSRPLPCSSGFSRHPQRSRRPDGQYVRHALPAKQFLLSNQLPVSRTLQKFEPGVRPSPDNDGSDAPLEKRTRCPLIRCFRGSP
ncbi:MAG: hypothetical protein BWY71_01623 [Planctomycetes bacterium ADurb.Bin412]|nr:MAG: hypothetical protein BWY71_01623 [Planctomycetes bacterium ADurb.Bin412]